MALCYLTEKRISADFMQHLVVREFTTRRVLLSFTIILIKMSEHATNKNFFASNRLLLFRVAIFD